MAADLYNKRSHSNIKRSFIIYTTLRDLYKAPSTYMIMHSSCSDELRQPPNLQHQVVPGSMNCFRE